MITVFRSSPESARVCHIKHGEDLCAVICTVLSDEDAIRHEIDVCNTKEQSAGEQGQRDIRKASSDDANRDKTQDVANTMANKIRRRVLVSSGCIPSFAPDDSRTCLHSQNRAAGIPTACAGCHKSSRILRSGVQNRLILSHAFARARLLPQAQKRSH